MNVRLALIGAAISAAILNAIPVGAAEVVTLDFGDGTDYAEVGTFYQPGFGISFTNAKFNLAGTWIRSTGGLTSGPLSITPTTTSGDQPIDIGFDFDASAVTIWAIRTWDGAGPANPRSYLTMTAFDEFDSYLGRSTFGPGSGLVEGAHTYAAPLTVARAGIRRVSLSGDNTFLGILFDDLSVTPSSQAPPGVPEPSTWAMMIGGFGLVGAMIRRRRVVVMSRSEADVSRDTH